ncbi:hypothetical protein, partial [Hydrotalea sp. AMD]|uniref:hypothetical protein n=1 Tax=Hydrotalea sp. AMD TaxID=2501297 RepID=UPI00257E68AB
MKFVGNAHILMSLYFVKHIGYALVRRLEVVQYNDNGYCLTIVGRIIHRSVGSEMIVVLKLVEYASFTMSKIKWLVT